MNESLRRSWRSMRLVLRALQVRLRFVVVLLIGFLVVGRWDALRGYWDSVRNRLSGRPAANQTVSADTEYFCPMDPGVISDWSAICPICNMDLVRRKRGEAVKLPDGVIARMQLSPYRVQLAGIRTSTIDHRPLVRRIRVAGRVVPLTSSDATRTSSGEAASEGDTAPMPGPAFALACEVDDDDLRFLTPGRRVEIRFPDISGESWSGIIRPAEDGSPASSDSPQASRPSVQIAIAGNLQQVRAGLYGSGEVEIPVEELSRGLDSGPADMSKPLAVPVTAVIDNGAQKLVYVESMPGMFDGVEVTLGPRCGDAYPVIKGLQPGQRVATVGAFLIDAEARLNPSLAAAYFGANRQAGVGAAPRGSGSPGFDSPLSKGGTLKTKAKYTLSSADQAIVDLQKICPVTDLPLGSMGRPVPVDVGGRKVFICCQGCEAALKEESEKYLKKLPAK